MNVIHSVKAMTAWSERLRRDGVTIGLVPTMGALHDGHRALIRAGRLKCDALVVSIFVNPTQFAPTEDLRKYPRSLSRDHVLCRAEGVDVCFEPSVNAMYPRDFQTSVVLTQLARRWEGEARPHHFSGVATVVAKLFGIVRPDLAVFGQKDFQQAAMVQQLIEDLNLGVKMIVRPTVRERDGLALSSRNVYLSPKERTVATTLYKCLRAGAGMIRKGQTNAHVVQKAMARIIEHEPAMAIDYLAVCEPRTLEPLTSVTSRAVLLAAVRLGSVRLIDNLLVAAPTRQAMKPSSLVIRQT